MKTLIIAASLFSAPASVADTPLFDLTAAQAQVKRYVTEDISTVSQVLRNGIREAMQLGIKVGSSVHTAKSDNSEDEVQTVAMNLAEDKASDEVK